VVVCVRGGVILGGRECVLYCCTLCINMLCTVYGGEHSVDAVPWCVLAVWQLLVSVEALDRSTMISVATGTIGIEY
jgi:hypothetical protein